MALIWGLVTDNGNLGSIHLWHPHGGGSRSGERMWMGGRELHVDVHRKIRAHWHHSVLSCKEVGVFCTRILSLGCQKPWFPGWCHIWTTLPNKPKFDQQIYHLDQQQLHPQYREQWMLQSQSHHKAWQTKTTSSHSRNYMIIHSIQLVYHLPV